MAKKQQRRSRAHSNDGDQQRGSGNSVVVQSTDQVMTVSTHDKNKVPRDTEQRQVKSHDSESDDETDLINAAAAWAAQQDDSQKTVTNVPNNHRQNSTKKKSSPPQSIPVDHATLQSTPPAAQPPPPTCYSLHVTQLSYDATDFDVRQHFVCAGCIVTSVRLVYDYEYARTKTFRGVAFVDVADPDSYTVALETLHGSVLLGRKINVRPVKTRQELAAIVQHTAEQVAEQIKREKAAKKAKELTPKATTSNRRGQTNGTGKVDRDGADNNNNNNNNKRKHAKRKQKEANESPAKKRKLASEAPFSASALSPVSAQKKSKAKEPQPTNPSTSSTTASGSGSKPESAKGPKLSKQQRNRRAAIMKSKK
jgi:RNA recognition motif-containing protein